ncbi:succinate dehydrogenase/fumarate reductase flavoprotein subunit, partial [Candidatus Saganbacteria bacterium]|nr:succinate dehydrogenase/fumarate reductase flavoprotein subunit [Candidatus Saganbacteria bacterium]
KIELLEKQLGFDPVSAGELELKNMLLAARLIARAALERTESRGAHYRTDYPAPDDLNWKKHLIYNKLKP